MSSPRRSRRKQSTDASPVRNLAVIDQAFGVGADLYKHVLGVQPNASSQQIQAAFLQRRRDLLERLELTEPQSDTRFVLERQVDSVVLAVRILADAHFRSEYDDLRPVRLKQWKGASMPLRASSSSNHRAYSPKQSSSSNERKKKNRRRNYASSSETGSNSILRDDPNVSTDSTVSMSTATSASNGRRAAPTKRRVVTPEHERSPRPASKTRESKSSPPQVHHRTIKEETKTHEESTVDLNETFDTLDEQTIVSEGTMVTMTTRRPGGVIDYVRDEVLGALEDTSSSLEQVLNAFTLQEEDIVAVMGKIDKAKRQMQRTF